MLERFRTAKAAEIASLEDLAARGAMPEPFAGPRPPFAAALRKRVPRAVIAEYKRASPSKGDINLGLDPEAVAAMYAEAGAGAISVLTEETYFKGDLAYLARMTAPGLPLLRKDFIFHPLQIRQTATTPASAVLLIVRMLDDALLTDLLRDCDRIGLEAVVEVFDQDDLDRAQRAGARIIQVNNRDLDTLAVDMTTSTRLIRGKKDGEFWITASGISGPEQLAALMDNGFDAALIGSSLMGGNASTGCDDSEANPDAAKGPGSRLAALLGRETTGNG